MAPMTLIFKRGEVETARVEVPQEALTAGDNYAIQSGMPNIEFVICTLLLNGLLRQEVIPRADKSAEYQATLAAIKAEADAKLDELEQERIKPFLPSLFVAGVQTTLPEILASLHPK